MKTILKLLFAPILCLMQACSPLGDYVDEEKSNSHYYNNSKSEIRYSPMGNWFEVGNTKMKADIESFTVFNKWLSRDKNHLFFEAYEVKNNTIDLATFYVKNKDYLSNVGFDKNFVYAFDKVFKNNTYNGQAKTIEGANPKTYVKTNGNWANDGEHHFYNNQLVKVDFGSFENINRTFSKDEHQIYVHYNEYFQPIAAATDVQSFQVLDDGYFAMDNTHVFTMVYSKDNNHAKLASILKTDREEVTLLNEYFLKIGNRVFYKDTYLKELDPANLEIINYSYIKDKNNVYFLGSKLEDADISTFRTVGKRDVGDKNGIYQEGERVQK